MAAVLTAAEIESLRFHLGFGNLQVGAYPWTPDGFFELFTNVIAVWLSDSPPTSATTAIDASAGPVIATVTPLDMTTVAASCRLVIDCDDDTEVVVVKSVTATTFTAKFKLSHDASGYPLALETGTSRLRYLLHRADRVHEAMLGIETGVTAGIASVDKGEVVSIGQNSVLRGHYAQYKAIVGEISSLVRVESLAPDVTAGGPVTQLEAY